MTEHKEQFLPAVWFKVNSLIELWTTVDMWYCRDSLQVDIAYVPFIRRFQIFFQNIKNYDITKGRTNLQKFIEVILTDGRLSFMSVVHSQWSFLLLSRSKAVWLKMAAVHILLSLLHYNRALSANK